MDRPLEDRVVVMTGASRGIGAGLAAAMHEAGARLVLAARDVASMTTRSGELGPCQVVACDVAREDDRVRLITEAVSAQGRIDVLVNGAGVAHGGPSEDEEPDRVARLMTTNLIGPLHLCGLAVRHMPPGSSIVNIASITGLRVMDRFQLAAYGASKAGLISITRQLAHEWGPRGVRVNAVAPGWFPTAMTGFLEDEGQRRWIEQHTSLGRAGLIEELTGPVVFLASDAASYVTGQVLAVDGGWV